MPRSSPGGSWAQVELTDALGLKGRVMLHVQCACFDSWHDWPSCDSIGIDVFPMDPMDSIGRLSNPPQSVVYTSGFIL